MDDKNVSDASWAPISKTAAAWTVPPNMIDYAATCATFSWAVARKEFLSATRPAGVNIADLAIDRHAEGPLADRVALRFVNRDGTAVQVRFRELRDQTNRFANVLRRLEVGKGERVFALTGRIPELYVATLGTLKNTSVFCPLFSAFGPGPIEQRLGRGDAKVLVTTQRLYQRNVAALRPKLPTLQHILLTDIAEHQDGVWSLSQLLSEASERFTVPYTDPNDMALLHFTSGTTGMPKGAVHVHDAAVMHYVTGKYALDLHADDVFWCTADPGWVTGMSYGIIAPLLHGVTNFVDDGDFDAERWYGVLERERISVWYTAPTAVRMLMRAPIEPRSRFDLGRLRFVASVGEPLNPSAVVWGQHALGLPIHDNWWQTETGGIMIANYAAMEVRPGSMGRPIPGVEAAIVRRSDDADSVAIVSEPNAEGELALRPGWPSMFRAYLHDDERYRKCFVGGWYLTGDLAQRDADGYYTFVGRADDIIKTAGHMVGPFEVESALMEHPAVAEAGVIGKPDPTIGEIVKAFVALRPGFEPSEDLRLELIGFGRKRLGSAIAPKELEFQQHIPRTKSGKIMRRLLKARELGLPEGDVSTLETIP